MLAGEAFLNRYHRLLGIAIILWSGLFLFALLPAEADYYRGADEGNYYRQGKAIIDHGITRGFKVIAETYINTPSLQDAPNPLRIATTLSTALTLFFHNSYQAISIFCLLNFMLLLAGTFRFMKQYTSIAVALLTVLLMACSPLEMAMARRALMDIPAMTGLAFCCFAFVRWIDTERKKYLVLFIAFTTYSILQKEVNVIIMPFFVAMLLYKKRKGQTTLSYFQMAIAIGVPGILTFLGYLAAFGYNDWIEVVTTMGNTVSHSAYSALWGQGPWYRTMIDYTLLSPLVMIAALCYAGYFLLRGEMDRLSGFILLLLLYLIVCYSILPKNVRYAILVDLPLRYMAASFLALLICNLKKNNWQQVIVTAIIVLLVVTDIKTFYYYFIEQNIYDPISFNLLRASKIIPALEFIIPSQ